MAQTNTANEDTSHQLNNVWETSLCEDMSACQVASVMSDSVRPHGLKPARLLCPWDFLGKNTGVGCHALL